MKLRPVLEGTPISLPVYGGFATKPAISDGYYVDADVPAFIPAPTFDLANEELGRLQTRRQEEIEAEQKAARRRR